MLSLIVIFVIAIVGDGSSADGIDCKKYYYNQLEYDFEKEIYDKIEKIEDFEIDKDSGSKYVTFDVKVDKLRYLMLSRDEMKKCINKAVCAAMLDMPLDTYFFHTYGFEAYPVLCFWSHINIKLYVTDDYNEKTKCEYDQDIAKKIDSIPAEINKLVTVPDKITAIHRYVIDTLSYDYKSCNTGQSDGKSSNDPHAPGRARSVYNAFVGDHKVVCVGYAEMFKVLCDKCNIPCIIVFGDGVIGNNDRDSGHAWNYVYVGDSWRIVDCTWDDLKDVCGTVSTKYLMSGADKCHRPNDYMNLKTPVLGNLATFISGDVELFKVVFENGIIFEPTIPEEAGKTFMYWYIGDENEPFDFHSSVTTDITLRAKWTTEPVFKIIYNSMGGSNINRTVITQDNPTGYITDNIPEKERCAFKGWNDSPTGNGEWFEANDKVEMESDMQLYAMWELITDTTNILNVGLIDVAIICGGITCILVLVIMIKKGL